MAHELQICEMSWVLGGTIGVGAKLQEAGFCLDWSEQDNRQLDSFSAKQYLHSVKGFLDASAHFVLAACAMLKDATAEIVDEEQQSGLAAITQHGASDAANTFFSQLIIKGPRLASPMIFPHSYASTAANLASMEFAWNGPHIVFFGKQDSRELLEYAMARLAEGSAQNMIVVAYEASPLELLPENRRLRNGALALLVRKSSSNSCRLPLSATRWRSLSAISSGEGSVQDMLLLLAALSS